LNIDWSEPRPITIPDGLSEEEAKDLITPFDLEKLLKPHSIEDQKAILGDMPDQNRNGISY
jgi:hypothetical protein